MGLFLEILDILNALNTPIQAYFKRSEFFNNDVSFEDLNPAEQGLSSKTS